MKDKIKVVSYGPWKETKIYYNNKEIQNVRALNITITAGEPKILTLEINDFEFEGTFEDETEIKNHKGQKSWIHHIKDKFESWLNEKNNNKQS